MEHPSEKLAQIAHKSRTKNEEHKLIVMDKNTHEEPLVQALQTYNKQFKIAVTFLFGYNGIFNVTNSNNNFFSRKQIVTEIF